MPSSSITKKLQAAEDRLNQELENVHGEYEQTKAILEKKIQLYNRYQKEDDITEVERLMISNKREWQMAHLLGLIEHEESLNKFSDLTNRIYKVEQRLNRLEDRINGDNE